MHLSIRWKLISLYIFGEVDVGRIGKVLMVPLLPINCMFHLVPANQDFVSIIFFMPIPSHPSSPQTAHAVESYNSLSGPISQVSSCLFIHAQRFLVLFPSSSYYVSHLSCSIYVKYLYGFLCLYIFILKILILYEKWFMYLTLVYIRINVCL